MPVPGKRLFQERWRILDENSNAQAKRRARLSAQGPGFATAIFAAAGCVVGLIMAIFMSSGAPFALIIDTCGLGALVGIFVDLIRNFSYGGTGLISQAFKGELPQQEASRKPDASLPKSQPAEPRYRGASGTDEQPPKERVSSSGSGAGDPFARSGAQADAPRSASDSASGESPFASSQQPPRSARAAAVDADSEFSDAPTPIPPPPRSGSYGQEQRQQYAPPPPRSSRPPQDYASRQQAQQDKRFRFACCFARAFFFVARADGTTRPAEMAVVDRFFSQKLGFRGADERLVDRAFAEAESRPGTIDALSQDILRELNRGEILTLFNGLYDIATIDGDLAKSEIAVINKLARALGVTEAELRQIRSLFVPDEADEVDENYSMLGLKPDATVSEIKSAFHRAVLENHPDRVAHLGEQAAKMATQRFLEVQKAYEAIRQERGF